MVDFDRESWIYIALIAIALLYFLWNTRVAKKDRKARKNQNFRSRYMERKRELGKDSHDYNNPDGSRIKRGENTHNKKN